MKRQQKKHAPDGSARRSAKNECFIPGPVSHEALADVVLKTGGEDSDNVRSYVEWQAPDETVKHLEKVASESVFGQQIAVWDVQTDKNRWWVITNPTNLYSQQLFPSMDYTLSFHIGLMTRMMQSEMSEEQQHAHDNVNQLWNKLARARSTLFEAKHAEDFQSVGMKCRECLLLLVGRFAQLAMLPEGQEAPQRGNFKEWCELIANHLAPGGSNDRLRSYLKDISKSTWELVNWLTHAHGAGRFDGSIATAATENVLESFVTAWARCQAPKQEAARKRGTRKRT
jgi:hypothetical protein